MYTSMSFEHEHVCKHEHIYEHERVEAVAPRSAAGAEPLTPHSGARDIANMLVLGRHVRVRQPCLYSGRYKYMENTKIRRFFKTNNNIYVYINIYIYI